VTVTPGEDEGNSQHDDAPPADAPPIDAAAELTPADATPSWRSEASDDDIDAAFAAIVSGITTDASWTPLTGSGPTGGGPTGSGPTDFGPTDFGPAADTGHQADSGPQAGVRRHPSGGGARPDTGEERARRRELRRLERAEEVAAYEAQQAEIQAERDADEAHFEPPEPPPLPRPKGRTIGAVLMLIFGVILLARPGLLAVGFDLSLVIAVVLILGGVTVLLTGIWRRRATAEADGWDDGAEV
jgi:hypothetical protein